MVRHLYKEDKVCDFMLAFQYITPFRKCVTLRRNSLLETGANSLLFVSLSVIQKGGKNIFCKICFHESICFPLNIVILLYAEHSLVA